MEYVWKIYKLTSPCGGAYVGITRNTVPWRVKAHVRQARKKDGHPLYVAIIEHGIDAFKIEVLAECYSEWEARKCERAMIAVHDTYYKNGHGFNRSIGGNGNTGGATEETRNKIKDSWNINREHKTKKLREAAQKYNDMGRPVSEEGRARKNEGLVVGRTMPRTEEQKEKQRQRMLGKPQPPTWKEKSVNNAAKARTCITAESHKKMGQSQSNRWADPVKGALYRHRFWALNQYEKALAARVGRERPHSLRSIGVRLTHGL